VESYAIPVPTWWPVDNFRISVDNFGISVDNLWKTCGEIRAGRGSRVTLYADVPSGIQKRVKLGYMYKSCEYL